jgi:hypothetical protein
LMSGGDSALTFCGSDKNVIAFSNLSQSFD